MASTRSVLITGAARRIGRALALDFADHGWKVGVHYHTSEEEAVSLAEDIKSRGGQAAALKADLAGEKQLSGLVGLCADRLAPVHCLVNNASVFEHDSVRSVSSQSWDEHLDVNLRAPVLLAKAFADNLPAGVDGNIINIIDQRVLRLNPQFFSYTISKSGLWAATRTMAQALAPDIRVNAIGPGPALASKRQTEENFKAQVDAVPLKRGVSLSEICQAAQFILAASSMTGQMIALDGGQHLAWETPDVVEVNE